MFFSEHSVIITIITSKDGDPMLEKYLTTRHRIRTQKEYPICRSPCHIIFGQWHDVKTQKSYNMKVLNKWKTYNLTF